jgi:hypothetical protein
VLVRGRMLTLCCGLVKEEGKGERKKSLAVGVAYVIDPAAHLTT